MSNFNGVRGCGLKKHDAFYIGGNSFSPNGILAAWSWWLGSGLEYDPFNMYLSAPPLVPIWVNPAASLNILDLWRSDTDYEPDTERRGEQYRRYLRSTKNVGLLDHVGSQHYTPWQFAQETRAMGPSRRVTKDMARLIAYAFKMRGPIPVVFTHADVPIFSDRETRESVIDILSTIHGREREREQTWADPQWGMYAKQSHGRDHFLVSLLCAIDEIKTRQKEKRGLDGLERLNDYILNLETAEQTIGGSWITDVYYTLPKTGVIPEEVKEIAGLTIIDLDSEGTK